MADSLGTRLQHAWNAFFNRDPTNYGSLGYYSASRPDRLRLSFGNEKSIVSSIYNRIAIDVASASIQHVRLDQNGRYLETIDSGLNRCFNLEANADQTGRAFVQDVAMSLFDEGCIAMVPIDTTINPKISGSYDIKSMRVGQIIDWYPAHVRVRVYNERSGRKEDLTLPKKIVGIIENPLYAVMNEPNSTIKRLIWKLNILDAIDEQSGSGKLDLVIQLPYVIKTTTKKEMAEARRQDLENQLAGSKYGIGYIDGTERITQLNRPVENNLMAQITYLTNMVFNQLGLTESIFDGTADEKTMLNYHNRTIEPLLAAITGEGIRKFLTATARSQRQSIMFYKDPFKLVPVSQLAEIADKFTRNEIVTSNEIRSVIGFKPSDDPKADELRNKNLNPAEPEVPSTGSKQQSNNMEGE
jgi:hypothetical protein